MGMKKLFTFLFIYISVSSYALDKIWEIDVGMRVDSLQFDSGKLYAIQGNDVPFRYWANGKKIVKNGKIVKINPDNGSYNVYKVSTANQSILNIDLDSNGLIKNDEIYFTTWDHAYFSYSLNDGKYKLLEKGETIKSVEDLITDEGLKELTGFNKVTAGYPFCMVGEVIYSLEENNKLKTINLENGNTGINTIKPFESSDNLFSFYTGNGFKYFNNSFYTIETNIHIVDFDTKEERIVEYKKLNNFKNTLSYSYPYFTNNMDYIFVVNPLYKKGTYYNDVIIKGIRLTRINKDLVQESIVLGIKDEIDFKQVDVFWRQTKHLEKWYPRASIYLIAVDNEGYIYIADQYNKTLTKYQCWITNNDIEIVERKGILNDLKVRIRKEPNLNGEQLGYLNKGQKVSILEETDQKMKIGEMDAVWYKVETEDGVVGWAYGWFIDIVNE